MQRVHFSQLANLLTKMLRKCKLNIYEGLSDSTISALETWSANLVEPPILNFHVCKPLRQGPICMQLANCLVLRYR